MYSSWLQRPHKIATKTAEHRVMQSVLKPTTKTIGLHIIQNMFKSKTKTTKSKTKTTKLLIMQNMFKPARETIELRIMQNRFKSTSKTTENRIMQNVFKSTIKKFMSCFTYITCVQSFVNIVKVLRLGIYNYNWSMHYNKFVTFPISENLKSIRPFKQFMYSVLKRVRL